MNLTCDLIIWQQQIFCRVLEECFGSSLYWIFSCFGVSHDVPLEDIEGQGWPCGILVQPTKCHCKLKPSQAIGLLLRNCCQTVFHLQIAWCVQVSEGIWFLSWHIDSCPTISVVLGSNCKSYHIFKSLQIYWFCRIFQLFRISLIMYTVDTLNCVLSLLLTTLAASLS